MSRYYVQPRDRIFVRGYGFFSFAKNMDKKIAKNISKSFSGKYIQKYLDLVKQSATDAFKTASKRAIQKISEATGDIFGNSKTVTNEHEKEIPKERYISPEKRQEIIDDFILK